MKKTILVLLLFVGTGILAYGSNNDQTNPGDPKKEKESQASFELTKDYFNLFAIFDWASIKPDTSGAPLPLIIKPRRIPVPKPVN